MFKAKDKIKEIFEYLEKRGYAVEIPQNIFVQELMRATDLNTEKSCYKWLKIFRELGYIKVVSPNLLKRCIDIENPYNFPGEKTNGK